MGERPILAAARYLPRFGIDGDHAAAAAWAAGLTGKSRDRALLSVAKEWAAADPETAGQWLQTLPNDTTRASATEAYIATAMKSHPDLAAGWLSAIPDDAKRNKLTQQVTRQWLQKDPAAAQAWLRTIQHE